MPWALRAWLVCAALLCAGGCKLVDEQPKGSSPLLPLSATPDSVTLEVFTSPVPLADPRIETLWREVDETSLSPELRTQLAQNGLRAGVLGPALPDALAELLKVTDRRVSDEERTLLPMMAEEGHSLLLMQPRAGERRELVTSHPYEEMPLLQCVDGRCEGKTLKKAECRLALYAHSEDDGRLRVELAPEVHYGEFRSRITGSDAMMIMKQERQKKLLAELNVGASLSAGQMLIITCLPDRPGSLGHYFFTNTTGEKTMQKLYVMRASLSGADQAFWKGPQRGPEPIASDVAD